MTLSLALLCLSGPVSRLNLESTVQCVMECDSIDFEIRLDRRRLGMDFHSTVLCAAVFVGVAVGVILPPSMAS
jgi:hypothetical protein